MQPAPRGGNKLFPPRGGLCVQSADLDVFLEVSARIGAMLLEAQIIIEDHALMHVTEQRQKETA